MKRVVSTIVALAAFVSLYHGTVRAADPPAPRVVAMYFHRTQRCPTCLKMGSYAEEAVAEGFTQEIKAGKVAFHYIDFQNEKNAAYTNAYKIVGPTLIVAKISGDKVVEYKNLTDIWTKVRAKAAFLDYVRGNIKDYQK
jgi:hypothetical protein